MADIHHHNIHIFEGPRYELDDEETIAENNEIMSKVPFAVVGANTGFAKEEFDLTWLYKPDLQKTVDDWVAANKR